MTKRERELEQALAGYGRTDDEEIDALVDTADDLTSRLAAPTPNRPEGRTMFIEGVAARKGSIVSSLVVPGFALMILLLSIAVMGRTALPGESLYPVRNVLRSAGLAEAPDEDIRREIDDAALLIGRARAAAGRAPAVSQRLAVSALMSLGRAEGHLGHVGADDRVLFQARIHSLRARAVALIRRSIDNEDPGSDGSGSGSDESDGDNGSGSGSDDSGGDDGSGSGSGSDDGSGGEDSSGSGSDEDSRTDEGSGSEPDDSVEADD